MRQLFPGYYGPSDELYLRMWREGIFILDANVLLDVYRYSDDTVAQLLTTLERLGDRLWLPHQAAIEYHNNLTAVVAKQQQPYSDVLKLLKQLQDALANPREHPFINPELHGEATPIFDKLSFALKEKQGRVLDLLNRNPIKDRLADLFEGKVGPEYTQAQLGLIYAEGKERFSLKIPPGYEDADKPEPERYGDLVLWKQILEKAASATVPLVFVTSDVKEDWFLRAAGRTISPRPELIAEINPLSGMGFHIYTTTAFLQYANKYLGAGVPETAIAEVKDAEASRPDVAAIGGQTRISKPLLARRMVKDQLGPNVRVSRFRTLAEDRRYFGLLSDGRKVVVNPDIPGEFIVYRPIKDGGYILDDLGPEMKAWGEKFLGTQISSEMATKLDQIGAGITHTAPNQESAPVRQVENHPVQD